MKELNEFIESKILSLTSDIEAYERIINEDGIDKEGCKTKILRLKIDFNDYKNVMLIIKKYMEQKIYNDYIKYLEESIKEIGHEYLIRNLTTETFRNDIKKSEYKQQRE